MEHHERPNRLLEEAEMDVKEAERDVEAAEDELMNAKAVLAGARRRYDSMRSAS